MRTSNARVAFLASCGFWPSDLVLAEQIHGNGVSVVTHNHRGKVVPAVDGLVSGEANVALGVRAADCVPLLFADPVHHILGAAHAGWKGTLNNIADNVVDAMKKIGADVKNIIVSIGPHIGACCYDVSRERAVKFANKFGTEPNIIADAGDAWHLDLGAINRMSLMRAGILPQHIAAPVACTSCQHQDYFSFRKDSKETFGEIMGVVAWK